MSNSRLFSGRSKKVSGQELDPDRHDFIDVSNAEPDLGLPNVNASVLIGDIDGTRTWIDITTYANDFRGYTGSKGDIGYTGSFGYTGSKGDIGYTGSKGDIGYTGSFGFTGSQGDIGYTGSKGDIGYTGSFGFTGSQGPQGNFGGVTFDYTFDTSTINSAPGTGKLRFNQSDLSTATALYLQDTDDNNANLDAYLTTIDASTSQLKGHIRISNKSNSDDFAVFAITNNSTNNGAYFSVPVSYVSGTASSFSNNEDIIITFARTGDKGDIGYTGSRGDTGYTGSQGDIGYTGSKGDIGFTGSQGEAGYIGADGYAGSQGFTGSQGYTGSQGDIGFTGSQGDIGYTGSQGDIGYTGSQGDVGYVGSQGDIGYTGSQGDIGYTGSQGDIGYTGSQGDIGYTGSQGDIGYTGSQGDIGYTGSQGDIGYTGSQGDIGYTGSQGTTGFVGSQGDIGYTGSQGDIGYTGSQGDIGYTGSQGDIGYTGSQGDIGYTGSQGDTGFVGSQGDLGYTGSQGVGYTGSQGDLGSQGYTGSQGVGYTGSKGLAGNFGGATFGYTFNSTTTVAVSPGSGKFAVNNSNLSTATNIVISRFDYYSNDLKTYLLTIADSSNTTNKGYLKFTSQANPQYFTFYAITGSVADNSGYINADISYVSGSVSAFANNEDMFLTFSRTGDAGGAGYTGSVGFTGSQGIAGSFAGQGYAGSQGYTGSAGTDGTSVEIVGTVASSANLPNPYNGSIGDGYITADTGNLWIWTGSSWTNVGRIVGYTGSAGPAGGYTGSAGAAGPLGFTGSSGAGFTGSQGASGSLYISMGMTGVITTPYVGTVRFYPPKNISMYTVYASVSSAPTAGNFTFIIKKNGVSIGTTFTISQNQTIMTPTNINVTLLTTDYLTLDVTGVSATDLFVKIEYINT